MDFTRGSIHILFKEQNPQNILSKYFKKASAYSHKEVEEESFVKYANEEFRSYSEDETRNIYYGLKKSMGDMRCITRGAKDKKDFNSVFNLLIQFGEDVLCERDKEPICKFEHMLRWRETSHKLEQDIFTTSYLAYKDVLSCRERTSFTWEPVIRSDNDRLHQMLQKGIAENHFHLKGSAPYFNLTWVSLMNRVVGREAEFKKSDMIKKKLNTQIILDDVEEKSTMMENVNKAAKIRAFLFTKLKDIKFFDDEENEKKEVNESKELKKLINNELLYGNQKFQETLNLLRNEFGHGFDGNSPVDYCITGKIGSRNDNENRFLSGERYFMYSMFKKIFERDQNFLKYIDLFYGYLIIKAQFRAELIQVNDRVGFKNFADYQDRKTKFLGNDKQLNDAIYTTAINSTMKKQNIKSLEARICPDDTYKETAYTINKIDELVAEIDKRRSIKNSEEEKDISLEDSLFQKKKSIPELEKLFYVIHFVKQNKDKLEKVAKREDFILVTQPRMNDIRVGVQKQAFELKEMRESMNGAAKRIYGIDACANEIGCRPEGFAQAFRYLSNHDNPMNYESLQEGREIHNLKITYHAGEDFLDLADGLRAIEEAMLFCNMKHDDRIGHALALGLNVKEWYTKKRKRLILPKQDYLDNIVWILGKIREFNITDHGGLKYELESQYSKMFTELYLDGKKLKDKKLDINIFKESEEVSHTLYYEAWKLRGDNPELYNHKDGYIEKNAIMYWDRCGVNPRVDDSIRKKKICSKLYRAYHFDPEVKKKGYQQKEQEISDSYIKVVGLIQKKMQKIILKEGIGIETNPSSNYLISNFKRYDKHPITNFNNLGLTYDDEKLKECPQLFVSINTDDQGVFGTYLENEYALMALGLEKAKDENGEPLYNKTMIYDWLDRVRQMGIEQSFKRN